MACKQISLCLTFVAFGFLAVSADPDTFLAGNVVTDGKNFAVKASTAFKVNETSLFEGFINMLPANPLLAVKAKAAVAVSGYRSTGGADTNTQDQDRLHGTKASVETCESGCNDDSYCWGLSYCWGECYLKSVDASSSCTAYFSNSRLPTGYKGISGKDYIFQDIHKYNLPADLCGQTCDSDGSCYAFSVCGDDCYLKTLKDNGSCTAYIK